jgi:propanol-preferring alcohol dehydrogenase
MRLLAPRTPLRLEHVPVPTPGPREVLLRVAACGVCRTDLHILDGELDQPKLPLVLGHEIVGRVEQLGNQVANVADVRVGDRVGVPWLGWTDESCRFCARGQENLCDRARFTGYTLDGGYAEYVVADARYCLSISPRYGDLEAAPLMCAGLIGYRTLRLAGDVERIGIYGFGAAAHIVAQVASAQGRRVYAFTRPGDDSTQAFARALGVDWAGGSDEMPPDKLDAALLFAPVGALVPQALAALDKGGVVVSGGIYMSDIPRFAYRLLWEERAVRSVANLTRADGAEFMRIAAETRLHTSVQPFPLEGANEALGHVRAGTLQAAAAVLRIG